jgi:glycosyltransferase involved in cell wall biosynthesis
MKEIILQDNPDISVIVPVYNMDKFLIPTLDSIVKQSYKNFEIIVVNDGSTDNSARAIEHFSFDRRLKVINQEHGGNGAALNAGHDVARGKYITYCSPGIVLYPMFLEILRVGLIQSEIQKSSISLIYGDFEFLNQQGQTVQRVIHNRVDTKKSLKDGYDMGIAMMYTKELWDKTGPYWDRLCENYQWCVRAAQYTDFGLVSAILAGYIVGSIQAPPGRQEQERAISEECQALASELLELEEEPVG